MKIANIFFLFLTISVFGQHKTPEDYGFRHIVIKHKSDSVDVLIKSKLGEENFIKPLFFFCQGSLPIPLIKFDDKGAYSVFPFNPENIIKKYHIIIVSKPFVPLIADIKELGEGFTYNDSLNKFPKDYSSRNSLTYYVKRNNTVLQYLQKQKWVSTKQLIVAGHSEGSTVAAKMALENSKITHLIYAGGNPLGRILSMIQRSRASETDSAKIGEEQIKYWENVVNNKDDMDDSQGDTYKATYEFSQPPIKYLEKLKIPILVSYGTKDWSAPFNDFMRVEFIRLQKKNVTYQTYIGTEHNFFPLNADNKPNYDIFNWDNVADDWLKWTNVK